MNRTICFLLATLYIGGVLPKRTRGSLFQELSTKRLQSVMTDGSQQIRLTTDRLSLRSLSVLAKLGSRSSFRYHDGRVHKSAKGVKRVRLIQTYGGYDVFGSSAEAEMDAESRFTGQMYGHVIRNLHKYIRNPEACHQNLLHLQYRIMVLEHLSWNNSIVENVDVRRIIFAVPGVKKARLAYKVEFLYKSERQISYPMYFIDACTDNILMSLNQLMTMLDMTPPIIVDDNSTFKAPKTSDMKAAACPVSAEGLGGNEKVGRRQYNDNPHCLNVKKQLTSCQMDGTYTSCVDNKESDDRTKVENVKFTCSAGYKDAVNGAYGVANDAFYHGEIFGKFFKEKYDMEILSYKPRVVVHFSESFENALSDGTDTFFGDGKDFYYPLVDLDVVVHELAHTITVKNSRLVYIGMSGGINEAFSDITAIAAKAHFQNSTDLDWTIGSDIKKGEGAVRYLDDPTRDGKSIKSIFRYRPLMDVHYSSGIFNYAFYDLVKEEKMDIFEAYKCFLDANLYLWRPFTNFFSGACNVIQAAYDNGYDYRKVMSAFRRTGIPLVFCNYAALSTTVFAGESRRNILVSMSRAPIFRIELDQTMSNFTIVKAVADGTEIIQIVVGKDDQMSKVITRGGSSVRFNNILPQVYVQLLSNTRSDVLVQLKTLRGNIFNGK